MQVQNLFKKHKRKKNIQFISFLKIQSCIFKNFIQLFFFLNFCVQQMHMLLTLK